MQKSFSKQDTQAMKGVAILLLFAHHLFFATEQYVNYWIYYTFSDEFNITARIADYAKMCVPMFVLLSGYGLTHAYERWIAKGKSKISFVADRYLSLWGGFVVIFGLGLLAGVYFDRSVASIYGNSIGAWLFAVLDGVGLAGVFFTPTANVTWWYMSFAIVHILLFPLLYGLVKRYGLVAPLMVVGMIYLGLNGYNLIMMSFAVLGIYLAKRQGFERMRKWQPLRWKPGAKALKFVLYILALWVVTVMCQHLPETFNGDGLSKGTYFRYWGLGIFGTLLMFFLYEFVLPLKPIRVVLAFLGAHSANLFMMHTFFYHYFFEDYYYSFEEPELILGMLLVTTLTASFVLELVKKWSRYDKGMAKLRIWLAEKLNRKDEELLPEQAEG